MYTKIIVPLDGSSLAEKALPYAASLTKQLNATLILLRVEEGRSIVVNLTQSPQLDAGNLIHSGNIAPSNFIGPRADLAPSYSSNPQETFTSYSGEQNDEDYLQVVKGKLVRAGVI